MRSFSFGVRRTPGTVRLIQLSPRGIEVIDESRMPQAEEGRAQAEAQAKVRFEAQAEVQASMAHKTSSMRSDTTANTERSGGHGRGYGVGSRSAAGGDDGGGGGGGRRRESERRTKDRSPPPPESEADRARYYSALEEWSWLKAKPPEELHELLVEAIERWGFQRAARQLEKHLGKQQEKRAGYLSKLAKREGMSVEAASQLYKALDNPMLEARLQVTYPLPTALGASTTKQHDFVAIQPRAPAAATAVAASGDDTATGPSLVPGGDGLVPKNRTVLLRKGNRS